MELLLNNAEHADAVTCLRWCVSEQDRAAILEHKIRYPHMLVVVARKSESFYYRDVTDGKSQEKVFDYTEVKRHLIPLTAGAVYQTFDRPGEFKICATIVGSQDDSVEKLRTKYLGDDRREIITEIGSFNPQWPYMGKEEVNVTVGDEFFAPPPPAWERWYFDLWPLFRHQSPDQCSWRRRRLFAYSLMPLFLLVWWLFRIGGGLLIYLGGVTQGRRKMNFEAAYNTNLGFVSIYRGTSLANSIFWSDADEKERPARALVHPWLLGLVMLIARATFGRWATWGQFIGRTLIMYTALLVVTGLIVAGWIVCEGFKRLYRKRFPLPNPQEVAAEQTTTALTILDQELAGLSCQLVKNDTANTHRTFRLKYQWFKAQVCRPYKRG